LPYEELLVRLELVTTCGCTHDSKPSEEHVRALVHEFDQEEEFPQHRVVSAPDLVEVC
jgi:hypothetical protein